MVATLLSRAPTVVVKQGSVWVGWATLVVATIAAVASILAVWVGILRRAVMWPLFPGGGFPHAFAHRDDPQGRWRLEVQLQFVALNVGARGGVLMDISGRTGFEIGAFHVVGFESPPLFRSGLRTVAVSAGDGEEFTVTFTVLIPFDVVEAERGSGREVPFEVTCTWEAERLFPPWGTRTRSRTGRVAVGSSTLLAQVRSQ